MRILQINKFIDPDDPRAGGPLTWINFVSRRLAERGHEVLLFGCVSPEARKKPPEGFPGALSPSELPTFIDYTRLPGLPARVAGALRIVHDPAAAAKLDAFLAARPVDVAHVHNIYHHLTPSIFAPLARRGVPVVMSVRDYRLFCGVKAFYRRQACTRCLPHAYHHCILDNCAGDWGGSLAVAVETFIQRFARRYINHVRRFLCPSEFMADVLRTDDVPEHKIMVLRNPIPMPSQAAAGSPDGGGRLGEDVLFVGRLSEEKGPELMLDLAAGLPDRRVVIVGDGPMRGALAEAVARRRLDNVELTGHVPHDGLGHHYRRAAVAVLPSRCFENSPHAMLEAMSCARCVVAPAHGPIGEWVRDGRTGRLFAPGDAADLLRVVTEALADAPARARMGAAAAELVRTWHDPADILNRLEQVYFECASR